VVDNGIYYWGVVLTFLTFLAGLNIAQGRSDINAIKKKIMYHQNVVNQS